MDKARRARAEKLERDQAEKARAFGFGDGADQWSWIETIFFGGHPKKICEIQNINTHGHRTNKLWGYFIKQEWPWVRLCARDISTLHVSSRCVSINQKVDMERLLVVLVSYLRSLSCKFIYLDFHGFISPFIHLVV